MSVRAVGYNRKQVIALTDRTQAVAGSVFGYLATKPRADLRITRYWCHIWGMGQGVGVVFEAPAALGGMKIMLTDPRVLAHYYARETRTYVQTEPTKIFLQRNSTVQFGRGIPRSQGEHKRQPKSLTLAFGQGATTHLTPIFYNFALKSPNPIQPTTLDLIPSDFRCTRIVPKRSVVNVGFVLLSQVIPLLAFIPTSRTKLLLEMQRTMKDISKELLARTRKEKEEGALNGGEDESTIDVGIKANESDSSIRLTLEEVLAQIKVLLVAGYETTSISVTNSWHLVRSRHMTSNKMGHPTFDAVAYETLRAHPPVIDFVRVIYQNMGGADAKVLRPDHWAEEDGIPRKAQDGQAYRHLLTARGLTLAEFKGVMSVLVKNFVFEMRDGPDTQVELGRELLPMPRIVAIRFLSEICQPYTRFCLARPHR
ncbi:cytochrome P450 [Pisolithus orientalis]|uniref:cytochrome P450 n=1 Tax=Pisolithus orientalis TaxID=936130 RepID=UPI00222529F4|nr:cytochrome P450 [Pisolithus orientalis]KAI6033215.1 cytochrome P450 [Pisolithus orientalis]